MGSLIFIPYILSGDYRSFSIKLLLVLIMWFIVAIAIIIDYISGVRKARQRNELRTSMGMRQTVSKVIQYYAFLIFAFLFDCILMLVLSSFEVAESRMLPFVTMGASCFLVFIEWRSFMEKADEKYRKQMERGMKDLAVIIQNREDLLAGITELIKNELNKENDEKTDA